MQDEQRRNAQLQKELDEQGKRLSIAESDKERFRQEAGYAQEQVRVMCICACKCDNARSHACVMLVTVEREGGSYPATQGAPQPGTG